MPGWSACSRKPTSGRNWPAKWPARSVPDALGAYQRCVAQRTQMAVDDGRRLFDDTQKMMTTITRATSKGLPAGAREAIHRFLR